jgi:hypothetical protein
MRNEYKVFIGVNKQGEAIYGEVHFGNSKIVDGKLEREGYFSVCFTTACMEVYNDELLSERMAERVEGWGYEEVGRVLSDNPDITYNELPDYVLRLDGREAVLDIDYFLPEFTLDNGDEVAFTFSGGGQHDTWNEFLDTHIDGENESWVWHEDCEPLMDMEFYIKLNDMWNSFHLKDYNKMTVDELAVLKAFENEFHDKVDQLNDQRESFLKQYVERQTEEVVQY